MMVRQDGWPPGRVDLILVVSESLLTTPFLTITPEVGTPMAVVLTKNSDLEYSGHIVISESTPTGTAYAVFSARDTVGNRGTEILSGGSIAIDTEGPAVRRLAINPEQPVRNDEISPVTITVEMGLNEKMKTGEAPELSVLLSGVGRDPIPMDPLTGDSGSDRRRAGMARDLSPSRRCRP